MTLQNTKRVPKKRNKNYGPVSMWVVVVECDCKQSSNSKLAATTATTYQLNGSCFGWWVGVGIQNDSL